MTNYEYGLTSSEVADAQRRYGFNELATHRTSLGALFFRQLNNPLLIILVVTALLSYSFNDHVNASIILGITALSVGLGFFNEYSSERTVGSLLSKVSLSALVIRNGIKQDIPVRQVAVGDIVLLHQGTVVPADVRLVESVNLALDESILTGESLPVRKDSASPDSKVSRLFMGTIVSAGAGKAVVEAIAEHTEYGRLIGQVSAAHPKTAFQQGLSSLGVLMTKVITALAVIICVLNIGLGRDPFQSILFALAVAIGLTPSLLPVIVTISMAKGAKRMAHRGVVVKQLVAIEDLGNMDVLCTDKTGTLTEGTITMVGSYGATGEENPEAVKLATLCNTASQHHRVVGNPMDVAILHYAQAHAVHAPAHHRKVAEEEFNYDYRGQFTVVECKGTHTLLFKGAADSLLERAKTFIGENGEEMPIRLHRARLRNQFRELNKQGLRLIVVGRREVPKQEAYSIDDVKDLELVGYLTFMDVPKHSAKHALDTLRTLGVSVKIVTGDNELVTNKICQTISLPVEGTVTGPELSAMSWHEMKKAVLEHTIFARVTPLQKEQIVKALRQNGKTVGYLGDGINDAAALHAADVGLSVNTAVDVAKDVASVVFMHRGLDVIAEGVREGRRVFANTIKYILMGTSSNFGNMFSVAGASFFFPFLPMTASQILLNNSLYDLSQLGLPDDDVDDEAVQKPHHWDIRHIYHYMLVFGPISSLFDYATFAVLWFGFKASEQEFQTGWFLVSIATQVLVVFVIRTNRVPFFRSRPSSRLLASCFLAVGAAWGITLIPWVQRINLVMLPAHYYLSFAALIIGYLTVVELAKAKLFKRLMA